MATEKTETKTESKDVKDVKDIKDVLKDVVKDGKDVAKLTAVSAAPAAHPRDDKRDKAIDLAVSTIEKQFGKGSIMRLGDDIAPPEVKVVPTGSLGLDIALGVGGLAARGRIVGDLRSEVLGQDDGYSAARRVAECPEAGRDHLRVRRRRARARRRLPAARKLGVRTDDSARLAAGHAASRRSRSREMLVRSGGVDVHRRRLGRGARAARRARGRNGRLATWACRRG